MLTARKRQQLMSNANANNSDGNSAFQNSFRIKEEGRYRLRFLPDKLDTPDTPSEYYRQVGMHFNFQAWDKPYFCPRQTVTHYEFTENSSKAHFVGSKCPICELYFSLLKSEDSEDKGLANSIKPSYRFIFNVIVLNHPKIISNGKEFKYDPSRVYVFNAAPNSLKTGGRDESGGLDQIWDAQLEDGSYKYPDLISYSEGIIIDVFRSGKGQYDTSYRASVPETAESRFISDPRDEAEWREKSFSLTDFVKTEMTNTAEELEEAVEKLLVGDEEDEEEVKKSTATPRRKQYNANEVEEKILEETSEEDLDEILAEFEK